MKHLDDDERRARLARRHGLHPDHRHRDALDVARSLTALHATEPATVHLAARARADGVTVADVDRLLHDERTLVKQLAMRRTLWAFPVELLPAAWGSASARVAAAEGRRLAQDVVRAGVADDPDDAEAWLARAAEGVLEHLAGRPEGLDARTLRAQVPALETPVTYGGGAWAQEGPVGPRLLTVLGARGAIVRGRNAGHWRLSRPAWTTMASWLGDVPDADDEASGYVRLVERWLAGFGPATEADLVWWLGATKTAVRRALADLGAVAVGLDSGERGWVLPGDDEASGPVGSWAALLPTLDPTTMGWKGRDFYLDPADRPFLFDSNGNAGTTAWVDGRIVGCWVQDDDGTVRVVTRGELPRSASEALAREAETLTAWLDGVVVGTIYRSPQMKGEHLP